MRQQMAALKEQLNQQIEVNELRLKKDIIDHSDRINSFGSWMLVAGVFTAILVPTIMYYMYGISLLCCIVTGLIVIADSVFDYYNAHRIRKADLTEQNFSQALTTLVKIKKSQLLAFKIGVISLIPMLLWWDIELYHSPFFDQYPEPGAEIFRWCVLGASAIGTIVGLWAGIRLLRKQTTNITHLIQAITQSQK